MRFTINEVTSVQATECTEKTYTWEQLLKKFEKPKRTSESIEDFLEMSKNRQLAIKDIGGFIGGRLKNNKKRKANFIDRQLLTIDADYAPQNFPELVKALPFTYFLYSTHKHTPEKPRYRLGIPFSEAVTSPEYYRELAKQFVKDYLDPEWVDEVSYKPVQIMFWPSVAKDGEYVFESRSDGVALDPGTLEIDLNELTPDFTKVQDPLTKEGAVGVFCKAWFPIQDAIDHFLPHVYESTDTPNRFTFINGSSSKGLVIYDNRLAFSNHDTDPAGDGHAKNAYDLICTHLFNGDIDQMNELVTRDERCQEQRARELAEEFDIIDSEPAAESKSDLDWIKRLEVHPKTQEVLPLIQNFEIILENDPNIKDGFGGINDFSWRHEKTGKLPWWDFVPWKNEWADSDFEGLLSYLERVYSLHNKSKTTTAVVNVAYRHHFHPIKEKLESLADEWDEMERVETFFIDYFGADDTPYIRAITRKMFAAAVTRIFKPGTKFDYVVVLVGAQGIGKSFTISRLAYDRWSNDLATFKDKQAVEAILGSWLIEIGEMTAHRKAENDEQKQFLTKTGDKLRMAYAKNTEFFPRQCIFIGSINEGDFLKDVTGNRRYWVVDCDAEKRQFNPTKALDFDEVDQIWAEAMQIYKQGEQLYLDDEMEAYAREVQKDHMVVTDEEVRTLEFANSKISPDYYKTDPATRRDFLAEIPEDELIDRTFISAIEVWEVGLGRDRDDFRYVDQKRIAGFLEKDGWKRSKERRRWDPYYGQQRYFVKSRV